jgi:hypothetical protein
MDEIKGRREKSGSKATDDELQQHTPKKEKKER